MEPRGLGHRVFDMALARRFFRTWSEQSLDGLGERRAANAGLSARRMLWSVLAARRRRDRHGRPDPGIKPAGNSTKRGPERSALHCAAG